MPYDAQQLAGLEVAADLHREPGVPCESLFGRHGAQDYTEPTRSRDLVRTERGSVPPMLLSITTTGKVTLLIVAGAFIALGTDHGDLHPQAEPRFPGHAVRVHPGLVRCSSWPSWVRSTGSPRRKRSRPNGRHRDATGRGRRRRDDRRRDDLTNGGTGDAPARARPCSRPPGVRRLSHARRRRRLRHRRPEPRRGQAVRRPRRRRASQRQRRDAARSRASSATSRSRNVAAYVSVGRGLSL